MKKILVGSLLAMATIGTTLNASHETKGGIDFTVGTIAFNKTDPHGAVGLNMDWQKRIVGDLYLGAGINAEFYRSQYPENLYPTKTSNDLGVILDVYPILSFNITNKLSINALYAYTIGEIGSETFDGKTYGFGAEWKFDKYWATGVNYKSSELEFTRFENTQIDTERYNATLSYRF